MDNKVIRGSFYTASLSLLVGFIFSNFGGWQSLFSVSPNFIGIWVFALVFTMLLSYVYLLWFSNFLPGTVLIKGVIFGTLVWLGFLILGGLIPYFKEFVYQDNLGYGLFVSLILHWIWGGTLSTLLEAKV